MKSLDGALRAGSIGVFWPHKHGVKPTTPEEPRPGFARFDGAEVRVDTLAASSSAAIMGASSVSAIAGMLTDRAVLLLDCYDAGGSTVFGQGISTGAFKSSMVVTDALVSELRSFDLCGVSVRFMGITGWAGETAVERSIQLGSKGGVRSVELKSSPVHLGSARLRTGGKLSAEAVWENNEDRDLHSLTAPVEFSIRFPSSVDPWQLIEPMIRIQDVLSFAQGGFVPASSGHADPDRQPKFSGAIRPRSSMWHGSLMVQPPGAIPIPNRTTNAPPRISLLDLGGVAGLARWVTLSIQHPRAVAPFLSYYRSGGLLAEYVLQNAAIGIEYWRAAHRRSKSQASWAQASVPTHGDAVALHAGQAFSQWVGDRVRWADDFWGAYNTLKHNPSAQLDPELVADLAASGRLLLAASVLNMAAGSKRPARSLFAHTDLRGVGLRIRDRYGLP